MSLAAQGDTWGIPGSDFLLLYLGLIVAVLILAAIHRRALFTGTCASCHKLGDLGKSEAGPPLNGMGAHGRAELLTHIIDPNREVDPSFWQWNVTTRKGETLVGVIASENATAITLRNPAGDVEIKKDDIATRENTRRSLMPEGLEALGADALRDILTFLGADGQERADQHRPDVLDAVRGAIGQQHGAGRRRRVDDTDHGLLRDAPLAATGEGQHERADHRREEAGGVGLPGVELVAEEKRRGRAEGGDLGERDVDEDHLAREDVHA